VYAVPALAWGRMTNDVSIVEPPSAFRAMLGGGVGFAATDDVSLTASFQRVLTQHGKMQFSLAVCWPPAGAEATGRRCPPRRGPL